MKNYLELTDTDLEVYLEIDGTGDYLVTVDDETYTNPTTITQQVSLHRPFSIVVELVAGGPVILKSGRVDGIEIIPRYDYLAEYLGQPTSYLDCAGKWQLTINRPFYQWLHQTTGQGWLFEPVST